MGTIFSIFELFTPSVDLNAKKPPTVRPLTVGDYAIVVKGTEDSFAFLSEGLIVKINQPPTKNKLGEIVFQVDLIEQTGMSKHPTSSMYRSCIQFDKKK